MSIRAKRIGFAVRKWGKLPRFVFVGAKMRAFLSPKDTRMLSCYHIALTRGKSIAPAYHKKAFELIWVIKGGGIASMGRRRIPLRRGDSLLIQPLTPHGFTAGSSGMVFLAVLTPRVDSQTDYYSCEGDHYDRPKVISGRFVEGRKR